MLSEYVKIGLIALVAVIVAKRVLPMIPEVGPRLAAEL